MKAKTTLILLVTFVAIACQQQSREYALEQRIMECFYQEQEAKGIAAKKSLHQLQKLFIKHDILAGKSGEDYLEVIHQIRDSGKLPTASPELLAALSQLEYIPTGIRCRNMPDFTADSEKWASSKVWKVESLFDATERAGDISAQVIAEEAARHFTAQDFENEYYRALFLTTLTFSIAAASM